MTVAATGTTFLSTEPKKASMSDQSTTSDNIMTKQEIFDTVYIALKAQGVKSYLNSEGCLYRGPNGTKCAAGHLILDGFYNPEFEGQTSSALDVQNALIASGVPDNQETEELISDLQFAHDTYLGNNGGITWEQEMRRIAAVYKVVIK
jgi:hypothetical protein